jgi:hypothetical protein
MGIFSKVASYRRPKQTMEYHLHYTYEILNKFPNACVSVEKNSIGNVCIERLQTLKPFTKIHQVVSTQQSKQVYCNRLKFVIESEKLQVDSTDNFMKEALNFRQEGEKLGAISGQHDDDVISLGIALEGAAREGYL